MFKIFFTKKLSSVNTELNSPQLYRYFLIDIFCLTF